MSTTHGMILFGLFALCVLGALTLLGRAPAGVAARRALFLAAMLAALLPFAIHAQQSYESLVNVAPSNRLPFGLFPAMDRFIVATWLAVVALLALGAAAAVKRPVFAATIPLAMALIYFAWLLPMAADAAPRGASPTAIARSWLITATILGPLVLYLAARRVDWRGGRPTTA